MKQAIKTLQKRFDELKDHHKQTMQKFDECEMNSDYEFLQNDLKNIELEQIELTKAIIILNKYVK